MNGFDIALVVFTAILIGVGLFKGLLRVLIGLASLVAAFALAASFHGPLASRLQGLELPDGLLRLLAYGTIFLLVIFLGGMLAFFGRRVIRAAMLGWLDRLAGGAMGLVAAGLVAALIFLPMVAYVPGSESVLDESVLAPYVVRVADLANRLMPDEMSQRYREGVEGLRRHWQDDV